ncbi:hypothetical protein EAX61_13895 [Dokdonia sinensis]|uniref:Uncharacterized protein n=1 Tax=Dokdonia sinensis TaxID=2479847 RepID=A0A3M0FV14_9FLAO|nr:hypothetical protein [Dokdonia sinensis]RMB56501.1 hypothetical protein EAX61_13895 [Dokdonia sinensis]
MKTKLLIGILLVLGTITAQAQTLGELNTKLSHTQQKPSKKMPSKAYIASFNVLVEVYREDVDYKAKSSFRGKGRGEAKAMAALGLKGVNTEAIQAKVDALYADFVSQLENNGMEVLAGNVASGTDYFKNAVVMEGPSLRESANPGYIECIPSGATFYVSKREAEGKASKKDGFLSGFKAVGKALSGPNQLSKDLDDVLVIEVDLALNYSEAGSSWFKSIGAANAQIKTNLMLGTHTVAAPVKKGLRMKGQESTYRIPTRIGFYQGSGLKRVTSEGILKKPLYIGSVVENTKVSTYDKGKASTTYDIGNLYRVTEWRSSISENAKFVEVDGERLADALYESSNAFLSDQINQFFSFKK